MEKVNQIAVFGGGCFWCTEAIYQNLRGVISVGPGYTGGHVPNPTYEQVAMGDTGHAESIEVVFDPEEISYADLLNVFFGTHDPTTPNRQGHDIGEEYRSAIFYASVQQKQEAEKFIQQLESDKIFPDSIVTELAPLGEFYEAEDYHKNYYERNKDKPYCQIVINPKIAKLKEKFAPLLKKNF